MSQIAVVFHGNFVSEKCFLVQKCFSDCYKFSLIAARLSMILNLALMETASFPAGVRQERYSEQQEIAPKNTTIARLFLKFVPKLRDKT
jgi:hypothetical protein